MSRYPSLGHLAVQFIHIPSKPMVIRRYRNLNERNLRTFFEEGLFCRNVPTFDDDNEGLVERAVDDPGMRIGAIVTANNMRRRRGIDELELEPDEFRDILTEFHRLSRQKYYANCWRLGTSELDSVWKNYTGDEEMVEGFAFETTVRKFIRALPSPPDDIDTAEDEPETVQPSATPVNEMYVGNPLTDMHVGAVRYQDRQMPGSVQPAGYQSAVNFFKGSGFDYELEFRFLFNPFDSSRLVKFDLDGRPVSPLPETIPEYHYFPADTREMIDRIVLAPNAGHEQRSRIQKILDDIGISYGPHEDADLEIVESNSRGLPLHERYTYTAEFDGTNNYDGTAEYLNGIREEFLEKTNADHWPAVDLVELIRDEAGTVVEGYRHAYADPDFDMDLFGHDGFQAVVVNRIFADGKTDQYMNEDAKERFSGSEDDEGA